MGPRWLLCCVLVAASTVAAPAAQDRPVQSDQEILIGLERRWNEAFYRKDIAFIETVLAEEFVATYEDGTRGDRARELAQAAAFNQQVESAIQDEFSVKVYGNTAVVWFTLRLTGIRQGQSVELTLRYTDVWVLRDGRWQCVSAHSTTVAPR
jgi:ketosteroid isomerase-like protein